MVVNNQDPDTGGREGLLAIVAIAVVLIFVIRIYSDYVTRTGQAHKPVSRDSEARVYPPKRGVDGRYTNHQIPSDYVDSAGDPISRRPAAPSIDEEPRADQRRTGRGFDYQGRPSAPGREVDAPLPGEVAVGREGRGTRYPDEVSTGDRGTLYPGEVSAGRSNSFGDPYYPADGYRPNPAPGHYVPDNQYSDGRYPGLAAGGREWRPGPGDQAAPYPGEVTSGRARDYGPVYGDRTTIHSGRRNGDRYPGDVASGRASRYDVPNGDRTTEGPRRYDEGYPGEVSSGRARGASGGIIVDTWPADRGHGELTRRGSYNDNTATRSSRDYYTHWTPDNLRGQIVVGREPGRPEPVLPPAPEPRPVYGDREPVKFGRPPRPQPIDGPRYARLDSGGASFHEASLTGGSLFHAPDPYPGTYDDIQIGDRLSEINGLGLPGGRLSENTYVYRPRGGPFKAIYATLEVGPRDPAVTGLIYMFRGGSSREMVERQALDAFGVGDSSVPAAREGRVWQHLEGYTVAVEPDRYTVQSDTPSGSRRRRSG